MKFDGTNSKAAELFRAAARICDAENDAGNVTFSKGMLPAIISRVMTAGYAVDTERSLSAEENTLLSFLRKGRTIRAEYADIVIGRDGKLLYPRDFRPSAKSVRAVWEFGLEHAGPKTVQTLPTKVDAKNNAPVDSIV